MRAVFVSAVLMTQVVLAQPARSPEPRGDVTKPLALLQRTAVSWYDKQTCTSCHQQDLPAAVFRMARERGFPLDDRLRRQFATKAYGFLTSLDRAVQNTHLIDPAMDYGVRLLGARDAGVAPSLATGVYARFIANRQKSDGRWITTDMRPPQAHSVFTATAVAMHAVQLYMPARFAAETRLRVDRAKNWLSTNVALTTEDRVFQLRGLAWAGVEPTQLKQLTDELIAQQRPDGGWGQLAALDSDAYATGEVLVTLREAGGLLPSAPEWQQGIQFLQRTQRPDGSWLVRSRMHEQRLVSPPYFESGFPYGSNQMISCMGTSWATLALMLNADAVPGRVDTSRADAVVIAPPAKPWMETALFGSSADLGRLLDGGLDPNRRTEEGTTLLMMAAPDAEKVRLLLGHGADVNARAQSGFSALMIAANYRGASDSVRLLLDAGARVDTSEPPAMFNASAAFFAVLSGDTDTLNLLAGKGANLRQKMALLGQAPVRPLDAAVVQRDVPLIQFLVKKGIEVNAEDPDAPISPLSLAVMTNDVPTARALIAAGADVNNVDSVGSTPLLHAASVDFGDTEMVRLLLAAGAKTDRRSAAHLTARQIAENYGHRAIARVLDGAH